MAQITFDENTDYDAVYAITKRMASDINGLGKEYCRIKSNDQALKAGTLQLQIAEWDRFDNALERFKEDVKAAYKYLAPIAPKLYEI